MQHSTDQVKAITKSKLTATIDSQLHKLKGRLLHTTQACQDLTPLHPPVLHYLTQPINPLPPYYEPHPTPPHGAGVLIAADGTQTVESEGITLRAPTAAGRNGEKPNPERAYRSSGNPQRQKRATPLGQHGHGGQETQAN